MKHSNGQLEYTVLAMIVIDASEKGKNLLDIYDLDEKDFDHLETKNIFKALKQEKMPCFTSLMKHGLNIPSSFYELINKLRGEVLDDFSTMFKSLRGYTINRRKYLLCKDGVDDPNLFDIETYNNEISKLEIVQEVTTMDLFNEYYNRGEYERINTSIDKFNKHVNITKGQLLTIGARPSVGKTGLLIQMAIDMARDNNKVLLFNLEMDNKSLFDRIMSYLTGTNNIQWREKLIGDTTLEYGKKLFTEIKDNLIIVNDKDISVSKVKLYVKKNKPDVVVLDYIGLINDTMQKGSTRAYQIGERTRKFKLLALEDNLLFIMASQLNRDNERTKRKPSLSDLRESGSIEQDSDIVILLHRETRQDERAEFIIAKNRNGLTGLIKLKMDLKTTSFKEF